MKSAFQEDELLPISGLAQLAFCPRRCALIHLEGQWEDNRLTAEGKRLHERADQPEVENRPGIRIVRALRLRSLRVGLSGQADVVEFHQLDPGSPGGVALPGEPGRWMPFPVEYKRGRPKRGDCDEAQLCAQALCLEEMLGVEIPRGALFYGQPRRRTPVAFDHRLRTETEALAARLHQLVASGETPPPVYEKKCESCSLIDICQPNAPAKGRAGRYLDALLGEAGKDAVP